MKLLKVIDLLQALLVDCILVLRHFLEEIVLLVIFEQVSVGQSLAKLAKSAWPSLEYSVMTQLVHASETSAIDALGHIAVRCVHENLVIFKIFAYSISVHF